MAWRSQMGRVLVGRSVVGRLWHRSLLGIYTRWLGLELPLRAATGYVPQCCGDQTKIRMEPERAGRVYGVRSKPELMRRRWKARISLQGSQAE